MDVARYTMLPPKTFEADEDIRFACLESPCRVNGVVLTSDKLDEHNNISHGAKGITVDSHFFNHRS